MIYLLLAALLLFVQTLLFGQQKRCVQQCFKTTGACLPLHNFYKNPPGLCNRRAYEKHGLKPIYFKVEGININVRLFKIFVATARAFK